MNFKNPDIEIIKNKKLFIFDMDGTIYLGGVPFEFAKRFIKNLRNSGKKVLFFTNNASHTSSFYFNKLSKLGFDPQEDEIMTSGDVTREFLLAYKKDKTVYMVATDELVEEYKNKGVKVVNGEENPHADIVVSSFDTSLTYEKLNIACRLVRNGAEYISTHPDFNCPTEDGFIPDSGAIAALITASTGKVPTYFGKPYKETIEMIGKFTGFANDEMCIFGDRLYTDIASGYNAGVDTVLVLSGEATMQDYENSEIKSTFVLNSVKDLL
jgi:HAD superfamily hydrolase (TIGR01450 family)